MHLWRNAVLLASSAGFVFALSACSGDKKDDTNAESDADTDADADTDTDADADADSDTDPPKNCKPEDICGFAGPKGQDCQFDFAPLNGTPKECGDWYKVGAKNCPNPDDLSDPEGNTPKLVDCQCFCMQPPQAVTKGDDPCTCLQGCMVDFCGPPKK